MRSCWTWGRAGRGVVLDVGPCWMQRKLEELDPIWSSDGGQDGMLKPILDAETPHQCLEDT
ncbi:hypothetical protein Hamer_G018253 [Homarus americanus]|uniref:Uncharacterized protein n=1 Tax=Homarus americanus TaxID=6706 RepID=A0A8J5J8D2_HOMAM|nr:hypothetical protein Hamer_G018253 [Homarus americanus]